MVPARRGGSVARPGGAWGRGPGTSPNARVISGVWASTFQGRPSSSRGRASASAARSRCSSRPPAAGWRSPTSSTGQRPRRSPSYAVASARRRCVTASLQLADDDSLRTLVETVDRPLRRRRHPREQRGRHRLAAVPRAGLRRDRDARSRSTSTGVMKLIWVFLPMVSDAVITHRQHGDPAPVAHAADVLRYQVGPARLREGAGGWSDRDKRFVSVHPTVTATRMSDMQGMPPERVAEVVLRVAARRHRGGAGRRRGHARLRGRVKRAGAAAAAPASVPGGSVLGGRRRSLVLDGLQDPRAGGAPRRQHRRDHADDHREHQEHPSCVYGRLKTSPSPPSSVMITYAMAIPTAVPSTPPITAVMTLS